MADGYSGLQVVNFTGDNDGDGIPDWYENSHPCMNSDAADDQLNYDSDAMNNMSEYVSRTDACNPD
jgi:hypothetical protein